MDITNFCKHVAESSFGARIHFQENSDSSLTIHSYSQSRFEKIVRAVEHFFRTLITNIAIRSCDFDLFRRKVSSHIKTPSVYSYLVEVFGENRLQREIQAVGLPLKKIQDNSFIFSREDLQRLFPRLLMLNTSDYSELISEIQQEDLSNSKRCKRVEENLTSLKNKFIGINQISDCSEEQLQILTKILLPFDSEKEPFLGYMPKKENSLEFFFSHEAYVRHIAYSVNHARQAVSEKEDWEFYIGKRIAQARLPEGTVLHHPEGILEKTQTIRKAGASKQVFEPLSNLNRQLHAHLFYQGTRGVLASDTIAEFFITIKEDFCKEIGGIGAAATYDETKTVLDRLIEKNLKITGIGFSLGGAHAQRDTILFQKLFNRLVTISSPGIEAESCHLFQDLDGSKEIVHNINYGDVITYAGEALIGATKDQKLTNSSIQIRYYVLPNQKIDKESMEKCSNQTPQQLSSWKTMSVIQNAAPAHIWTPGSLHKHETTHLTIEYSSKNTQDQIHIRRLVNRDPAVHDTNFENFRNKMGRFIGPSQFRTLAESIFDPIQQQIPIAAC
ncbi:MAG: hypothetical protein QRY74_01845 [Chlamydia sp.]